MMCLQKFIPGVIGGALLVTHSAAHAGILATDPNSIAAFRGTTNFTATMAPFTFHAAVDHGVYAPGTFNTTFGAGADPSNGTQFVYAYQMFNTGAANEQLPNFLSVGFNGNQNPANIEFLPNAFGNFGIDPTTVTFVPAGPPFTSATWSRNLWLPAASASEIVLFTSPNGPGNFNSSVKAGPLVDEQLMPSPIPEPGTLTALAAGAAATLLSRRRRKP
jgi:hypothetical protein